MDKIKSLISLAVVFLLVILVLWKMFLLKNVKMVVYNDENFYIINKDYLGSYDLQISNLSYGDDLDKFSMSKVLSYEEYENYCKQWNLKQKYFSTSKKYIVFSHYYKGPVYVDARLADVKFNNSSVDLYVWDDYSGNTANVMGYSIIVPVDADEKYENVNVVSTCTRDEFNKMKDDSIDYDMIVDKPVIYLYPDKDTNISVKLSEEKSITTSYPKYNGEWNVYARTDGSLKDLSTGRNLYALYYENESNYDYSIKEDGFIVSKDNIITFLEEKLEILGLNERESEEFIIYWLPKLEENEYNYIRFATKDEINKNMSLSIDPIPDNIIRVLMTYKGLDKPIKVKEQKLFTPKRNGFVVVEWGGTEIK